MSAHEAVRQAHDLPAVIAGTVPASRLARALAEAGLRTRYDSGRNALIIEPRAEREVAGALVGMSVYNSWSRQERMHWHQIARSSVPADAWEAWRHVHA
jgi:hypothetical protein